MALLKFFTVATIIIALSFAAPATANEAAPPPPPPTLANFEGLVLHRSEEIRLLGYASCYRQSYARSLMSALEEMKREEKSKDKGFPSNLRLAVASDRAAFLARFQFANKEPHLVKTLDIGIDEGQADGAEAGTKEAIRKYSEDTEDIEDKNLRGKIGQQTSLQTYKLAVYEKAASLGLTPVYGDRIIEFITNGRVAGIKKL